MTTFEFTSGNPDRLVGGDDAFMSDIQGPLYDIRSFLNSGILDQLEELAAPVDVLSSVPILEIGQFEQRRAGRVLAPADFTLMGLSAPAGLWRLGDTADSSGNGRTLTNKGSVPFGSGITATATEAAVFAGSTAQALYIADTGAADPFRIKTGSWGCWFRTAKRGATQGLIVKGTAASFAWAVDVASTGVARALASPDGTTLWTSSGSLDVADDRWHFVVATHDGTKLLVYVDGAQDGGGAASGALMTATAVPLDIGAYYADAATAATSPNYGRVDEAFATTDVLSPEQVRNLYCASLPHTLGSVPSAVRLSVRRCRRGAALAIADFPAQPVRLHNLVAGVLTDQGSNGITLTANPGSGAIVDVAAPDGTKDGAKSFSGAHNGLSSTDAGLPATTAARSLGAWLKGVTANGVVLSWGTTSTADAKIWVGASTGPVSSASGADNVAGPAVIDGLWHHVVVVEDNAAADGVKRKLYLDGRLVAGSTVLTSLTLAGANRFRVGANPDGTTPFVGQVSRAFVSAVAFTPEQVRVLYNASSQQLAPSPKDATDHVEALEAARLLVVFDTLEGNDLVDIEAVA